ncbi:MAG: right-handed parallel beta-helix repeat-containing protein [Candidatus Vogelbacteria bacterium]|nr:right-handed parallel beta-helix repeat-containing protein [Candidatus Vogelbacteria bacterium]
MRRFLAIFLVVGLIGVGLFSASSLSANSLVGNLTARLTAAVALTPEQLIESLWSQVRILQAILAELLRVRGLAPGSVGSCRTITTQLVLGSRDTTTGGDVTRLQQVLRREALLNVAPTGYLGPLTYQGLLSFQKRYVLVGWPSTLAKLNMILCPTVSTVALTTGTSTGTGSVVSPAGGGGGGSTGSPAPTTPISSQPTTPITQPPNTPLPPPPPPTIPEIPDNLLAHLTDPDSGWTSFDQPASGHIIFVSQSGADTNNGLSAATAVKTIAKAKSLARNCTNGSPYWILFERGKVWSESFGDLKLSGCSSSQPLVVGSYGVSGNRPILAGLKANDPTPSVSNVALVGLKFTGPLAWRAPGSNILIEDSYFANGLGAIEALNGAISQLTIRRSIIVDAVVATGRAQGLFVRGVNGLTIEESVFDHNGWRAEGSLSANAAQENHNIYLRTDNNNVVVRRNIIARASSHGLQARAGGEITENLFIRNPIAVSFGFVLGNQETKAGGVTGAITDNIILEGTDMIATTPALPRGFGLELGNVRSATVSGNVIARDQSGGTGPLGIKLSGTNGLGVKNIDLTDNIIYEWRRPILINNSAGTVDNISINDNVLVSSRTGKQLVELERDFSSDQVDFTGNGYWLSGGDGWFKVATSTIALADWVDTSARQLDSSLVNLNRPTVPGGYSGLLNTLRGQNKDNWRDDLMPPDILDDIRNQLNDF